MGKSSILFFFRIISLFSIDDTHYVQERIILKINVCKFSRVLDFRYKRLEVVTGFDKSQRKGLKAELALPDTESFNLNNRLHGLVITSSSFFFFL